MSDASATARRFRPTTSEDVERDGHRFDWLKPDGWREGFRALALEVDGDVIGVGRIGGNSVHPRRDLVELEIAPEHRRRGHGTALLRELREYSNNPLSSKVEPGSERDLFLRAHGAVTYLEVPLLRVDLTTERTARWIRTVRELADGDARVLPWSELPREQLIDALTDRYLWQHASWSPTAPRDVIRPIVGEEFYEESDLVGSWAVLRDGAITALADLYSADRADGPASRREGAVEAVDAAAPHARVDVALCLAALLEGLRADGATSLDLDNHPTDPHAAPLLATLDREKVDPVHLVEIPGGLTATLRELTP